MIKTKLSKNGMITLPAEIRKRYNIKIGDEVGFIEEDGEYKIIPILKMEDLIDPSHFESTKKLIDEMRKERDNEA
jgi:AbrB family looped-hinge helix DNA binding protein